MSEHETQNAIINLITLRGGVATRVNSGLTLIKNTDGTTRAIKHANKGTADILAVYEEKFLAIEVKFGNDKPTPEQLEFGRQVQDAGGLFLVAYDVEEVNQLLDAIERE